MSAKASFDAEQDAVTIFSADGKVFISICLNGEWKDRRYDENAEAQRVWECDYNEIIAENDEIDVDDVSSNPEKYLGWVKKNTDEKNAVLESKVAAFSELVAVEIVQSDKLGYDWRVTKIGNLEAKKEYVAQENPAGTRDNPILYCDGVQLIDNAYYIKDGKRQVYMDGTWTEF